MKFSEIDFSDAASFEPPESVKPPRLPPRSDEARRERIRWFNQDVLDAHKQQAAATWAWEDYTGSRLVMPLGRPSPPGMLHQRYAANERVWRNRQCRRLRNRLRRKAERRGQTVFHYAVTLIRPDWIIPELEVARCKVIRLQVQRQAKRLDFDWVVTGVLDICPSDDRKSGTKGWAYHVHLTVTLIAPSYEEGWAAIHKAFPYKSDDARGVPCAIDVREAYDLPGWDHYCDKLFQWGGVRQRVVLYDAVSDTRREATKPPLTLRQQREWANFISQIRTDDLMIWVAHRRYQNRVLPMKCNRSKSARGQVG